MYQLGELQILRAVESEVPIFDTFTFFPDATKDVIEAHSDWLMPRYIDPNSIDVILCIQSYIIKTSHHTILVDTCVGNHKPCLLYTSPSPRDRTRSRMPSSA